MKHREPYTKDNTRNLRKNAYKIRPKISIALDTNCLKCLRNEWVEKTEKSPKNSPWQFARVTRRTVPSRDFKSNTEETAYLNALCELAEIGEIEFAALQTVQEECVGEGFKPAHEIERLDRDVQYRTLGSYCSALRLTLSAYVKPSSDFLECGVDVGEYTSLIKHLTGKRQIRDVYHYILADIRGVDVFMTLDMPFLSEFLKIDHQLSSNRKRTKVFRPSQFCNEAGIEPIYPPDPNPRASLGSPPSY